MARQAKAPKLPKGYEPSYTSYELITKTSYDKPYKPAKIKAGRAKPVQYVQPVKIMNPGALKGGKGKRR